MLSQFVSMQVKDISQRQWSIVIGILVVLVVGIACIFTQLRSAVHEMSSRTHRFDGTSGFQDHLPYWSHL